MNGDQSSAMRDGSGENDGQRAQRMAIVEAFAEIIKGKRTDAIEARRASGIEDQWQEDQDHYDGIDNANRGHSAIQKGRTTTDGLREVKKDTSNRSTVFLKITRPYVDAAAARVSDMLLPTDDRNFAIKPEPRPALTSMNMAAQESAQATATQTPPQAPAGGIRGMMSKMFGAGQPQAQAPQALKSPTAVDIAAETIAKAKASAERAQEEIDDWLVQCRYHAEVRKVIEGAAKVGTGILKGPHPVMMRSRAAKEGPEGWAVEMVEKIAPTSKFINHWNFYPDGACGDNIQNGSYVFECDDITPRRLTELKADPSYIAEMIDMCIEEGPTSPTDGTRNLKEGQKTTDKDLFQIWYFHGQVSKKDMEAAGCKCGDKEMYPAMVTMVNDRVIKVTMSPLDSGEFPYDVMVWQAKPDHWAGDGVSRQMRECQKGGNAAVRNLMGNAGLSAGPQIIVNRNKIVPANGRWELTPRKVWYTKADEDVENVNFAFTIVNIETRQAELMSILQFWLKEAEDVTGLPMLLQGQQGSAPDTATGTQIINNNGSTVLRRIARTFDDRVTEPHIGRYYEYLLIYGPDEAKGQFTIDARGSSALVERDLQNKALPQLLVPAANPIYGLDPELIMRELLKSMRLDPKAMELSDEKKQEMAQRPPPEDPRVTAAKIMAKSRNDAVVAGAQIKKMELTEKFRDADADRALKQWIAQINAQLADKTLSSGERQHLESMKVQLADTTLKLRTQTDLTLGAHTMDIHKHNNPAPQVATPAFEPSGRAPPGQAYTA